MNILQHKFQELKSKKIFKTEMINAISRKDSHTVPLEVTHGTVVTVDFISILLYLRAHRFSK